MLAVAIVFLLWLATELADPQFVGLSDFPPWFVLSLPSLLQVPRRGSGELQFILAQLLPGPLLNCASSRALIHSAEELPLDVGVPAIHSACFATDVAGVTGVVLLLLWLSLEELFVLLCPHLPPVKGTTGGLLSGGLLSGPGWLCCRLWRLLIVHLKCNKELC